MVQNKDDQLSQPLQVYPRSGEESLWDLTCAELQYPCKIAREIKYDTTFSLLHLQDLQNFHNSNKSSEIYINKSTVQHFNWATALW